MEERALGAVQVLGPVVGVHRPAAETDDASARVEDGEHQSVAEPVIGGAAAFGRDQHAHLNQIAGLGAPLDQRRLQPLAVVGRIAQAKPLPLVFGQAAPFEIFPRRSPGRATQIGREPFLRQVHPVSQALALVFALCGLRVLGRHLHPGLGGQTLDRLGKGQPFDLLKKGDDVAVLARTEVVVEALVIIDEKRGRLLFREGAQAHPLASLTLELHRPADHIGRAKAGLQFFQETVIETHRRSLARGGVSSDSRSVSAHRLLTRQLCN